jgi:hypothetical protein
VISTLTAQILSLKQLVVEGSVPPGGEEGGRRRLHRPRENVFTDLGDLGRLLGGI